MAVDSLRPPQDGVAYTTPSPSLSNNTSSTGDGESSPAFLALVARVTKTETALAGLSAQVSSLSATVASILPSPEPLKPKPTPAPMALGSIGVFSPFDEPVLPTPSASSLAPSLGAAASQLDSSAGPTTVSGSGTGDVAALTQQVAALSMSVAQLQKIQHTQGQLVRSNSGTAGAAPALSLAPGAGIGSGSAIGQQQGAGAGTGVGTTAGVGPRLFPDKKRPEMTFNNGVGNGNGMSNSAHGRPGMGRSISTSVVGGIAPGSEDKWMGQHPHPHPHPHPPTPGGGRLGPGHLQMPSGMAPERSWSPGGMMMTPSVNGPGAATPGAGIVVTKWDHLNLKPDLLRGVAKYGIGPPNKIQARVLPFMLKGSDIIAQAPPTQERIIAYVIPSLQACLVNPQTGPYRGPTVIIVTTTVDQATQCHKLVRNIGGPLGIRSALVAGVPGAVQNDIAAILRDAVHLLIGTPAKLNEVMRGVGGGECRLLVLDEVDQLIARNLYENVLAIAKVLPPPRRGNSGTLTPRPFSPGVTSPYDAGQSSPFNPASKTPFPTHRIERQTCIFSNTIPTDVINFSQSLNVRDPVRVLVRRDGGPNSQESVSSVTPGINLKHTYVYLTIAGSVRSDAPAADGPGAIGSGRTAPSEEATRAKEYKLDMLVKILDDYPLWQAVIHVGTPSMLEAVVYKLQGRSWDTLYLAQDMPPAQKKAVLQQWRMGGGNTGPRFLVVFDVNVKPPEIPWAPLVINFDLPRSVEGYAARAAAAVPPNGRQVYGVIVSFVQAAGGDVEMLRSTECAYRFKSAEIPSVFHDLFQH